MSVIWLLVADRSDAKIFESHHPKKPWVRVTELEHQISRLKVSDLVSDRPGRTFGTESHLRHAFSPDVDPLVHASQVFAKELAMLLEHEQTKNRFTDLVLVAEPGFMGILMAAFSKKFCQNHLASTVGKGLTHLSDLEIEDHLKSTVTDLWQDPRRWVEAKIA